MHEIDRQTLGEYEIGIRSNTFDPDKTTIILVHGIGVSSRYYVPLAKLLSANFNVFAINLPGYGGTKKPSKPLNVVELADVTATFVRQRALSNVIVVGHSMGCQVVAQLSATYPQLVKKVILLSPTTNNKERTVFMQGIRLFQDIFLETPKVNFIIFSDYVRMGVLRYLKTSTYMVNHHIEDILANASVPYLIVRGEHDPIARREWVAHLASLSPAISTAEISGAPHAFQYTFAKELEALCLPFLAK
jgi:pimeloyl-ACP methyl ester carboxylesterase